jgi:asparagine synthase (glutamine-hydrolysing)
MEMRHSIEGRVPFLDHHVVEAALAIPIAELAGHDIDKPVLRAAVADIVPPHILARPKHPFLAPPLARLAPSLVQDTLRAHARRSSLVDGAALVDLLDRLPAMTADEQQRWDPALMLLLSASILEARYCR